MRFVLICSVAAILAIALHRVVAPSSPTSRPAEPIADPDRAAWVILATLGALALAHTLAPIALDRHRVYDDAFMSYRYAKHLAFGEGLRWNPGEAPVEGYTNFLLVVVLAPFVRLGLDPLAISRILGVAGVALIAIIVGRRSRRQASIFVAVAVAATYLVTNEASRIAMLGLETLPFAALAFLAFHFATDYFASGRPRDLARCALTLLAAVLTRPEAVFLAGLVTLVSFGPDRRAGRLTRHLAVVAGLFWAPLAAYLVWKLAYFGTVLPNPAYVKASATGLFVARGVDSVLGFFQDNWKLVGAALIGVLLPVRSAADARGRLLASAFVAAYAVFYVRVDTLMDDYFRFMFPVTPFLFELARPAVERAHSAWLGLRRRDVLVAVPLLFVLMGFADSAESVSGMVRAAAGKVDFPAGPSQDPRFPHCYHLRAKARTMGLYPRASEVLIASVDAGVIAYHSGSRHLDTVGLNDRTIARERDLGRLTEYFFGRRPTLIMQRARIDGTLITYGHGPLGDTQRWAMHPGWNDYVYAGSITDVDPSRHEMHLFLRRDFAGAADLLAFLRERVIDRLHPESPIRLGTVPMVSELAAPR